MRNKAIMYMFYSKYKNNTQFSFNKPYHLHIDLLLSSFFFFPLFYILFFFFFFLSFTKFEPPPTLSQALSRNRKKRKKRKKRKRRSKKRKKKSRSESFWIRVSREMTVIRIDFVVFWLSFLFSKSHGLLFCCGGCIHLSLNEVKK